MPRASVLPSDELASQWYRAIGRLFEQLDARATGNARSPAAGPMRCVLIGLGCGHALLALLEHAMTRHAQGRAVELILLPDRWPAVADLNDLLDGACRAPPPGWDALLAGWPAGLPGLHRIMLPDPSGRRLPLRVLAGSGEPSGLLRRLAAPIDALAIIASHDPARPESPAGLLRALKTCCRPQTLLLHADAGALERDAIGRAAFDLHPAPSDPQGWPPDCAFASRRGLSRPHAADRTVAAPATVAVIGAGLAGSVCAAVLAREGWRVLLIDGAEHPVAGNRQPRLADHPHLSPDDNFLARLSRHGLAAARRWREPGIRPGRLQLAADAQEAWQQRRACEALGPNAATLARPVDAREAAQLAGLPTGRGGLWLPACEAHDPEMLARAWRRSAGIECRFGAPLARWSRHDDGWHLLDPQGRLLGRADALVFAAAGAVPPLARSRIAAANALAMSGSTACAFPDSLPGTLPELARLRGQSTRVRASGLEVLRCIVAGNGYVCPLDDGTALVGASTGAGGDEGPVDADDHANIARLARLIPAFAEPALPVQRLGSAVGLRFSPADRLPLVGQLVDDVALHANWRDLARNDREPLPRVDTVHVLAGLGARGSLWAPLGAELIADRLAGRMPAIEGDLLDAIDAGRFVRQRLRRTGAG